MTHSKRAATLTVLIALAACAAHAADDTDGSAVIIDTDKSVVLAGGNVHPSKPVAENLVAMGGRVVVDQPVGGHAVLAGGSIDLRAPVGGKLRAGAGSLNIEGNIGGGASVAAGEVRIAKDANVAGYAHVMAGTLTIDGRIGGPLKATGDRIIINGEVAGDVKAAADEIVLGPGARIAGSLQYVSGKELSKAEGAVVSGTIARSAPGAKDFEKEVPRIERGAAIVGTAVTLLALLGCGALFLAVAPIFSVEAPDRIKSSPWKSLGVGLLSVLCVPLVALLFILTIVGIPVGVMLFTLYSIALLLGFVVGTLFIGNAGASLLKRPPPPTIAAAVGYFAIALALVFLVSKAPAIGGLALAVLILLGLGAFEVELYRRMKGAAGSKRINSAVA